MRSDVGKADEELLVLINGARIIRDDHGLVDPLDPKGDLASNDYQDSVVARFTAERSKYACPVRLEFKASKTGDLGKVGACLEALDVEEWPQNPHQGVWSR